MFGVEALAGFVEEEKGGFAYERAGEKDETLLSGGQGVHGAVGVFEEAEAP